MTERAVSSLGEVPTDPLSVVAPHANTVSLRARIWQRTLRRLGIVLPDFVVHDLGLLLAVPNEQLAIGVRREPEAFGTGTRPAEAHEAYARLVVEFSESQACLESRSLDPNDDMVAALLARLLARVSQSCASFQSDATAFAAHTMRALQEARLYLLTVADSLDMRTLRLVGMLEGKVPRGALNVVDMLAALDAPGTNAIVQFSLQILPSVLEAKQKPAASDYAAFGYAGLSRHGSVDSLVLTEFCWDEPELLRRMLEDEVLYYAREQGQEETRRVHHLLIDASASMRGQRATFARGMALASAKKLLLTGDEVHVSFFDARLYESHACRGGKVPVAHILSFQGERGRNPRRVFHELAGRLELFTRRDSRQHVVHLFTHAALYIPRQEVERLAQLAWILAVFMLPSNGTLQLDYLDLLHRHWVVDEATLGGGASTAREAERILDAVDDRRQPAPGVTLEDTA